MKSETKVTSGSPEASRPRRSGHLVEAYFPGLLSRRMLFLILLLVAVAVVYAPASAALGHLWSDTVDRGYVYGYLILLISIWLLFRDAEELNAAPVRPAFWALPVLLIASLVWLIFWRAAIQDLYLLVLPPLALVAVYVAFGRAVAGIAALPVLFILFGLPFWGNLSPPLQSLSALAVGFLASLTHLPAFMHGNFIELPAGTLEIAEGCSGINFLTVGIAMATLYGALARDALRYRLLWIVLMGALALLGNWLRIYIIAVVAYDSHMQSPLIANHYWLGWVIFALFFVGFLFFAEWLSKKITMAPVEEAQAPIDDLDDPLAATVTMRVLAQHETGGFVAALVALAILPVAVYVWARVTPPVQPGVAIAWPADPAGAGQWQVAQGGVGPGAAFIGWRPVFEGPTVISRRRLVAPDGDHVKVLVVAYREQTQGKELVGYGNSLLGAVGEEVVDPARLRVVASQIIQGKRGPWRELTVIDRSGGLSLIRVRYQIGNRHFAYPHRSELWYGLTALIGHPVSSLIALKDDCTPNCIAAQRRLDAAASYLPVVRPAATAPAQLSQAGKRVSARK